MLETFWFNSNSKKLSFFSNDLKKFAKSLIKKMHAEPATGRIARNLATKPDIANNSVVTVDDFRHI